MSALGDIPPTPFKTLTVIAVLAILFLLAGVSLLVCLALSRYPGHARYRLGCTIILLVSVLLIASTGALVFDRSPDLVKIGGDLAKFALLFVTGTTVQSGGGAGVSVQSAAVSRLDATFAETEDGTLQTTWTGLSSGITQPIFVIISRDYSLSDGKTYTIIEPLYGYPDNPDSIMQGVQVQETLNNTTGEGITPPTIIVGPSLNVNEEAHDCADTEERPAVYTQVSHDVPTMIRYNLSNTTSHRGAWMIGGFSAGAYCMIWTTLRTLETYDTVASLSGHDIRIEGQVTNRGEQYLVSNTLLTMLANRIPDGVRIYAMTIGDNAVGDAYTALKMAPAVEGPGSVITDIPLSGGRAGPLWREYISTMLA